MNASTAAIAGSAADVTRDAQRLVDVAGHLHGGPAQVGDAGHGLHGLLDVEAG